MTQPLAGAFETASRIRERRSMIEAEVDMRAVDGNVGIVIGHLPRPYANAGDLLSRPYDFDEPRAERDDLAS